MAYIINWRRAKSGKKIRCAGSSSQKGVAVGEAAGSRCFLGQPCVRENWAERRQRRNVET